MVRLRKIERNDIMISCTAFFEDCASPVDLSFDTKKKEFLPFTFPEGYEWCKSHIAHIKRYLLATPDFPSERNLMWY